MVHVEALKVEQGSPASKINAVYLGTIEYEVKADMDTGAGLTLWGREECERYMRKAKDVQLIQLKYPIKILSANKQLEYSRNCFIDQAKIKREDGSVRFKNVVIYVVDGPWGSLLLGWPVLYSLGLTPEQNLSKWLGKTVQLDIERQMHRMESRPRQGNLDAEIAEVVNAKQAGEKSHEMAEAALNDLYDAYQVEEVLDECGFVLLNGDTDLQGEDVQSLYCTNEALDMEVCTGDEASGAVFVDYRNDLPRTKKHYPLGAAGRAWRARPIRMRRGAARKQEQSLLEHLEQTWKAGVATATAAAEPQENEIIAESRGDAEDTVFKEEGVLNFPDEVDFEKILQEKLKDAVQEGCEDLERLEEILRRRRGAFATKFSECRISKLTPLKPQLKEGAQPVFGKARRMSLEQLEWLKGHIKQLEALGMVKRVHNPVWGVPVFVVAKPHGKGWRMVADFRAVNSRMIPTSLPLPLLEQMLGATAGAKVFGSLDNMKGFDGLAATDTEPFTLVTPFGCYQMMVAPMGYLNSAAVYQDRIVHEVLKDIHGKKCVNWIDDNLLWGKTEAQYLDRLDEILGRYEEHNVKLNFPKCLVYKRKVVWGGREFSDKGYCYDPKFYDKVLETPEPELAVELHDFIFALGWIQDSLEPFGILEAKSVLADFLNELFKVKTPKGKAASRKKKNLVGMKLKDFGWGAAQQEAFKKCLEIVHKAIRVAVPDKTKELCLFTDASTVGCSIFVTQTNAEELLKPIREQKHDIIFMTTHRWDDTETRWHISSQEAYPIVFALNRLDYLFAGRKINIYMDCYRARLAPCSPILV